MAVPIDVHPRTRLLARVELPPLILLYQIAQQRVDDLEKRIARYGRRRAIEQRHRKVSAIVQIDFLGWEMCWFIECAVGPRPLCVELWAHLLFGAQLLPGYGGNAGPEMLANLCLCLSKQRFVLRINVKSFVKATGLEGLVEELMQI